ncbi:hypothetical protein HHI36_008598 [Cryptolaemus montrouzieri]|uniref:Uncharacterized protein n=1 Tax=Cryptolaemus montrouzieri TaxID=559131 RepID=A0ABD2MTH5_9CUCU
MKAKLSFCLEFLNTLWKFYYLDDVFCTKFLRSVFSLHLVSYFLNYVDTCIVLGNTKFLEKLSNVILTTKLFIDNSVIQMLHQSRVFAMLNNRFHSCREAVVVFAPTSSSTHVQIKYLTYAQWVSGQDFVGVSLCLNNDIVQILSNHSGCMRQSIILHWEEIFLYK